MYPMFQHSDRAAPVTPKRNTLTLEVKTVLINGKFPLLYIKKHSLWRQGKT